MKILEKKLLITDELMLLVSDDSLRRFNVAQISDSVDVNAREIDWSKAHSFYFEKMVDLEKAEEVYNGLSRY